MNNQINWDQTLVKKYSSSNHFKLLTQLRNEIEKYPLNRKKNKSSDLQNNNKFESNNNQMKSSSNNYISNNNQEVNNNKSTISFNNSKNFSIYKNITNDNTIKQTESNIIDQEEPNDILKSSSFKDRLNQIDVK